MRQSHGANSTSRARGGGVRYPQWVPGLTTGSARTGRTSGSPSARHPEISPTYPRSRAGSLPYPETRARVLAFRGRRAWRGCVADCRGVVRPRRTGNHSMTKVRVVHVINSFEFGGAEAM